jgi:hypothetical protein
VREYLGMPQTTLRAGDNIFLRGAQELLPHDTQIYICHICFLQGPPLCVLKLLQALNSAWIL